LLRNRFGVQTSTLATTRMRPSLSVQISED
jgi:hypothetical protein